MAEGSTGIPVADETGDVRVTAHRATCEQCHRSCLQAAPMKRGLAWFSSCQDEAQESRPSSATADGRDIRDRLLPVREIRRVCRIAAWTD